MGRPGDFSRVHDLHWLDENSSFCREATENRQLAGPLLDGTFAALGLVVAAFTVTVMVA